MTNAHGSTRPGMVLADSQYASEANSYLQSRLRIFYGVVVGFAGLLYVVAMILYNAYHGWAFAHLFHADKMIHLVAVVGAAVVFVLLSRGRFQARTLLFLDALGLYIALGTGIAVYALKYEDVLTSMPTILALFVIGRAVVVPCSPLITFLLSLGAPAGMLAVELGYGTGWLAPGIEMAPRVYHLGMVWNQIVLLSACGIAAVAAQVNFGLRLQVQKARQLGQYKLESRLGTGSMGEVYRATHAMLRRPTAVKLLNPDITGAETLARFEREVRETSRLTHPNTVRIYDYGHTPDGVFYYAMELLDGMDLRQVVEKHGPMPAPRAIHVLAQACAALREAHALDLVHRDIKAGNIMLCRRAGEYDVVKVVDFGLVKDLRDSDSGLTQMGTICGTPETLAPEIVTGAEMSPAADLYALGCVGYYLLTGHAVFDAGSALEFLTCHMKEDPPPLRRRNPNVPEDLEAVIMHCLAKLPGDRHASAGALRGDLLRCKDARLWTQKRAADWWESERA